MPTPILDYLGHDHARLAAHLERARAPSGRLDLREYAEFRGLLVRHLGLEDRIVIPTILRAAPSDVAPLFQTVAIEHAAIAALLLASPDVALADELGSFLIAHERAESGPNGVYALADVVLARRAETIIEAMRAYPRVPVAPYRDGPHSVRTARAALDAAVRVHAQTT